MEFSNSAERQIEIEATVQSDIPLKSIKIVLGDISSGASRGEKGVPVAENSVSQTIRQKVSLMEGSNYIEIVAENSNGGMVSRCGTCWWAKMSFGREHQPKRLRLIFCHGQYDIGPTWSTRYTMPTPLPMS